MHNVRQPLEALPVQPPLEAAGIATCFMGGNLSSCMVRLLAVQDGLCEMSKATDGLLLGPAGVRSLRLARLWLDMECAR